MRFLLHVIFFALFSTSVGFVRSRSLHRIPKTTILDVTASIQKTQTVFATEALNRQKPSFSAKSSLTLQLHSRMSVQKHSYSDYKSLTLARLQRDSARVRSLTARLDLALRGIGQSDLEPADTSDGRGFEAENMQGPVVSGTSEGSGEYFSRVGIGEPPSSVYMVLDTGSDVNWLQCAPCADCYQQADPIFEPASSSSYAPL